ncbi:hypothetical protein V502_04018 [Pseudogymnoascus sp. VKM F-4520 (FW-2644)]|nr:hypothetical protein V502_04018 [Pseudogymnoascus sp. VKM F-4520 (FW-2644)]
MVRCKRGERQAAAQGHHSAAAGDSRATNAVDGRALTANAGDDSNATEAPGCQGSGSSFSQVILEIKVHMTSTKLPGLDRDGESTVEFHSSPDGKMRPVIVKAINSANETGHETI